MADLREDKRAAAKRISVLRFPQPAHFTNAAGGICISQVRKVPYACPTEQCFTLPILTAACVHRVYLPYLPYPIVDALISVDGPEPNR